MEYVYYFYYHLNPIFPKDKIIKAIKDKNWPYFKRQFDLWGESYLPEDISVFNDINNTLICIEMNEENFYKIDRAEYECG